MQRAVYGIVWLANWGRKERGRQKKSEKEKGPGGAQAKFWPGKFSSKSSTQARQKSPAKATTRYLNGSPSLLDHRFLSNSFSDSVLRVSTSRYRFSTSSASDQTDSVAARGRSTLLPSHTDDACWTPSSWSCLPGRFGANPPIKKSQSHAQS